MRTQPNVATAVPLQIGDAASCKRWIEQLTLTNIQLTRDALTGQLASLAETALPALERLKILETLQDPVHYVQGETAKRYSGKPLPLEASEMAAWEHAAALWRETGRNYQLCLTAYRDGETAIAPHAPLVTLRCLRQMGSALLDYYRIYRQPPPALWHELHELHAFAESHGYARIRVAGGLSQHGPESSCAETYVQILLTHLANPYALSLRQMGFVTRWLERWAALVGLSIQPPPSGPIPLLAVDLTGSRSVELGAGMEPKPHLRYLDLEPLSKTLRQAIHLLKQGQTPGQLDLGDDARQPGCENLLMLLYVQWCRAGTARVDERVKSDEPSQVCFGLPAAHFHIGGGSDPRQSGDLTARARQDTQFFGGIARTEQEAATYDQALELWQILDHSASGFMCIKRDPDGKVRVSHNQLLAVRRVRSRNLQLGIVQWLRMAEGGDLVCGVRLFPGIPQAISARPSSFTTSGNDRLERALLLPEVSMPATPATLVLPTGWFQSGGFLEIHSERKQVAKLLNLLEKGSDFDRGTIVVV